MSRLIFFISCTLIVFLLQGCNKKDQPQNAEQLVIDSCGYDYLQHHWIGDKLDNKGILISRGGIFGCLAKSGMIRRGRHCLKIHWPKSLDSGTGT